MFGVLNADNYTSLHYNPKTGVNSRERIRYADNTFEPVRKSGNVNRKSRNKPGAPDWWVTERPLDWNPAEHGHEVTLNHDYGGKVKPAYDKEMENKPPQYRKLPYYETDRKYNAKMSADSGGGGGSEGSGGSKGGNEGPVGGGSGKETGKSAKPGGSTLTQGSEGFWEMQAREKAAEQESASGDSDPRPHVFRGEVGSSQKGSMLDPYGSQPDWWQLAQSSRASGHKGDGNLVFADNSNYKGEASRGEYAGHKVHNGKATHGTDSSNNQMVQKELVDVVNHMLGKDGVPGLKSININSTNSGGHSENSRHYKGGAIDINEINGAPVTEANEALVESINQWLIDNGYGVDKGWENLNPKTDPGKHYNHFHLGMPRKQLNNQWKRYK